MVPGKYLKSPPRDLVMVPIRIPAIMIKRIMTGVAMAATRPVQLMSGKTLKTTSQTRCWKLRVKERMMMFSKISLTM